MRGKVMQVLDKDNNIRITPAYAGKGTFGNCRNCCTRITPAYAGKSSRRV